MLLFHYLLLLRGIKYVDIPREKFDARVYNALCFITSVIYNNKKII